MIKQRGNILFLILLAVALFAALTYAVVSSSSGGGKNSGDENAKLAAAELLQIATEMKSSMIRSRVVNNIPDYGWDFFHDTDSSSSANATCTNNKCRMFKNTTNDQQGLISIRNVPESAKFDKTITKPVRFHSQNTVNVGTDEPDLVAVFRNVNRDTCVEILDALGIDPAAIDVADNIITGYTSYSGNLTSFPTSSAVGGDENTFLVGQPTGCVPYQTSYIFYTTLIGR